MKLKTIRVVRRWNTLGLLASLYVGVSGAVQILLLHNYWIGTAQIAISLILLTVSLNLRPEKDRRRVLPKRFAELAEYNAVMHATRWVEAPEHGPGAFRIESVDVDPARYTDEEHARMADLQAGYRAWRRAELQRQYGDRCLIDLPGGGIGVFPDGVDRAFDIATWLLSPISTSATAVPPKEGPND